MDYLSGDYGLVGENDPTSENGQLFLAEYLLLLDLLKPLEERTGITSCMNYQLKQSYVEEGLYNRNPFLLDRTLSHDNLIGIMSYSYMYFTTHRFQIWSYLLKHLGTYDNTKGKSGQLSRFLPFNPSNFFIWGLCAESNIYLFFLPFYLLSFIITLISSKDNTGSKILEWVSLYPHKNHWLCKYLFRVFEWKMKRMYGNDYLKELFNGYHGKNSKEFPICELFGIGV
jgi:hypothetical protein